MRRQSLEPRSFAPPLKDHSVLASRWWQARTGLMKALSKNRRRWFVLVQPAEGAAAVFRYYDAPPPSLATPPKGFVIINNKARLQTEVGSPLGRNAFSVASQGKGDPMPVVTVLCAETNADTARWMKALTAAISTSGGKGLDLQAVAKERLARQNTRAMTVKGQKQANLAQLARLEADELRELPLPRLHEICVYLDIHRMYDRKDKDRKHLADLIMGQRNQHAAEAAAGVEEYFVPPQLRTWGSMTMEDGTMQQHGADI